MVKWRKILKSKKVRWETNPTENVMGQQRNGVWGRKVAIKKVSKKECINEDDKEDNERQREVPVM